MWFDVVALSVLGLFAVFGALRGALASGSGLVSLVVAYLAAASAAHFAGGPLADRFGLPQLIAIPLAGTAVFFGTYLLLGGISSLLQRWERRRRGDEPRTALDRGIGGTFGALRGGMIVLLFAVLVNWIDAARDVGSVQGLESLPQTEASAVVDLSETVVEGVLGSMLAEEQGGAIAARFLARPGVSLQGVTRLLEDERLRAVQDDPLFWRYVEAGAVDNALHRRSFHEVASDPELRGRLADLGVVSDPARDDPGVFRSEMREALAVVGPRIRRLREAPDLQRLARDPEIIGLVERGDTLALVRHPEIRRLVARLSER